jgi:hypothetical protein
MSASRSVLELVLCILAYRDLRPFLFSLENYEPKHFIFFDKSEKYIKKHRGAQPLVHKGYTKGS